MISDAFPELSKHDQQLRKDITRLVGSIGKVIATLNQHGMLKDTPILCDGYFDGGWCGENKPYNGRNLHLTDRHGEVAKDVIV